MIVAPLDRQAIEQIIPHRDPFLLIDEITELEPGVRAVGRYLVPADAWFLRGHFPGNPVVPGAVLIGLVDSTLARAGHRLTGIERAKFRRPVAPGEEVRVSIAYTDGSTVTFELRSRGDIVAHGTCWIRAI